MVKTCEKWYNGKNMLPAPQSVPAAHAPRRHPLRAALFLEVFLLLTISVGAVTVTAFLLSSQELRSRTEGQLNAAVRSRALLLENTIAKQREQISILAQDPKLASLPSVTKLVGFQQLLDVDASGNSKVIAQTETDRELSAGKISTIQSARTSLFHPIISERGWTSYIIAAPKGASGGMLLATFDAEPLTAQILRVDYLGNTAEVLLTTTIDGKEVILHNQNEGSSSMFLLLEEAAGKMPSPDKGQTQGLFEGKDYAGINVIGAERKILSIGWSVVVKMDRFEVTGPPLRIAMNLASAGLFVVGFLSLSMFFLSRKIVGPLEELTKKFEGLETKKWKFGRTIFTGNELEAVDEAGADLTERLRGAYDHLEAIVQERTKELIAQLAQDKAILQSMEDGLMVTDPTGTITYVNHAAAVLTGWTEEHLHGRNAANMLPLITKDGTMLTGNMHPLTGVLEKGQSWHPRLDPELILVRKNGDEIALQIRVTPILEKAHCIGAVALIRDMTEERRIDRMKSEFITLVSHQLRTPLSSMRWYLEMLLNNEAGELKEDQRSYVKEVDAANGRMVQLVNALLNVSKIELGTFTLHPTPIDVSGLVSDVIKSLETMQLKRKTTVSFTPPTASLSVASDRSLLTLIVENLVSNAIKYSGGGSPVQISVDRSPDGKEVILKVRDRGIGIPAAQQAFIGRKLFRGTNATTLDTNGNGLGLYISMIAAETIGAKLTFQSTETEGTTFFLTLPMQEDRSEKETKNM